MTTKEKAIELYNKFLNPSGDTYLYGMLEHESAKESALIAVDEILFFFNNKAFVLTYQEIIKYEIPYWQEVKQEIEKL
jgi:hypothetical protein